MPHSRFESLGAYLPDKRVTTTELLSRLKTPPAFDLEKVTGIAERRVHDTSPDSYEDSCALAVKAADDCLSRSRYAADELDVVISTSITRSRHATRMYMQPSLASTIAESIGATTATTFDVSNACAGMMTGTYILDRMIRAGLVRNGMVVSGEAITPISDTAVEEISEQYDLQFASLTVGDSGAAVVLDRAVDDGDRIEYIELATAAQFSHLCLGMPSDKSQGIALYTDNRQMHNEARFLLWTDTQRAYYSAQRTTFAAEKFDFLIHHQFGAAAVPFMNAIAEREFGAPMPTDLNVLSKYGNTSTTSHFIVLHDYLSRGEIPAGSRLLMVPAASGVVGGFLSTTISSLKV
ncbi:putative 3-oxoacyl-[acyl-carrier-protein] synthase III [Nocardia brasiliensis NBRC 14402]|uniref:3-oxoacyl-ACP synthase III family protein n=1 Tax=Nocardia brasiliensis TaxID=37326 RepID=UPI0002E6890C|nr:3-oxoacyl-[acyl-carrier-protein] synthase III C-terminal domain-containing protein [Nocardia brasiliensis]ASF09004.1 3-oxoacyl-ACP synthase [Nocardia brasiliensis]GAJ80311.1 putative 3-oxoacyl-[acyl-carrier-protein] synthase III [Nocardia brasiliensis NBRC 14402]SUB40387.1 3-oxoacyl-[acyl-carrier-protein] synthase 3 [Nocardia brasiliensis]